MEEFYDKTNESAEGLSPKESVTPERPKTMAYSVASLLLALMSIGCCCMWQISVLLGALAIVFAVLSRRHLGYFDSMAVVGLIVGIVGTVFGAFVMVVDLLSVTEGFEAISFK